MLQMVYCRENSRIMKEAAEILKKYLETINLNLNTTYSKVFKNWMDIAGEDIASHSAVKEIEHNTLIIEADHPGWIQIIQLKKAEILRKVKKKYPGVNIKSIKIILNTNINKRE